MKAWVPLMFPLPFLLIQTALGLWGVIVPPSTTCQTECGNITIPYPFGIGSPNCFRPGFNLTCDQSLPTSPKLFLGDGPIEVTDIFLSQGHVRIKSTIATIYCSKDDGIGISRPVTWTKLHVLRPYTFSETSNTIIAIGCGVVVFVTNVEGTDSPYASLCASACSNESSVIRNGSCSGIGCCQTSIGKGMRTIEMNVIRVLNLSQPDTVDLCIKAFLIERQAFSFSPAYLSNDSYTANSKVPVILDWAILEGTSTSCQTARNNISTFACKSENSYCYDAIIGEGYRCNCSKGFEGNPYISNGCKDIDECEQETNPCPMGSCVNNFGGFSCAINGSFICVNGYESYRCSPNREGILAIHIGTFICTSAVGVVFLIALSYLVYGRLKQRNIKKHREKCFRRNHGLLLQQLISSTDDNVQRTKIFTLEELQKATNNFDNTRILGRGGHGTVYKGILSDQRVVAIKKSEIVVQREIEQFVNEVAILSQINHRNVVKLFGCCLEAEVPLLVYEFISGGTLSDRLHIIDNQDSLSFKDRLKIATEIAAALAYLHSAATISIFHRDVKTSNILLDHNYTPKVADFGASRLVPLDKTRITTAIQGTFGYLDPEYYHTGQLTEKSDVYSFGVILVELLTGKRAISETLLKDDRNLAMHFIWSLKENCLFEVLDTRVAKEGRKEVLEAVATLAEICLRLKGEERPTMKKVEHELNVLNSQKIRERRHGTSQERDCENATNDITRSYSLEKEFMLSINQPR